MSTWSSSPSSVAYKRWKDTDSVVFRPGGGALPSVSEEQCGDDELYVTGVSTVQEQVEHGRGNGHADKTHTDETFTVEDAVEAIGFGVFQWKLSLLTGVAWMADAIEMMILSVLGPQLHCEWRLPSWEVAFITSVVFIGMMLSSSLWGNISDKYGRKWGLILCMAWTLYYGLLSCFAPVYGWILILRGLVGFGIGGAPQSVTLYSEFLPSKSRATCIILIEIFWALGAVFEVLLAMLVMPTLGWRWLLAFSTAPLVVFIGLCFVSSQSHRLVMHSRKAKVEPSCSLECSYLTLADYKDLLWTTLAEFPGLFITLWVIDRLGRRKSMVLCFVAFSICILPLYACIGRVPLTIFIFIARAFITGGWQAAYVYTPEVYPTVTRAVGIGTSSGLARVGALLTPFVAQVLLRSSVYLTLSVYCVCSLLAAVAAWFLPIETAGRGMQESTQLHNTHTHHQDTHTQHQDTHTHASSPPQAANYGMQECEYSMRTHEH
ncbi:synaptic vesicle 2-related protein-like [Engraulis encrasicolus]|uniref:synaptic vesicle 2-related protein-like n=1 Tax=Engraulis encrasicolus TaxID=184585 RepID=UPI002FD159FA